MVNTESIVTVSFYTIDGCLYRVYWYFYKQTYFDIEYGMETLLEIINNFESDTCLGHFVSEHGYTVARLK